MPAVANARVTVIPAKKDIPVNVLSGEERKRLRVAAYARVSTKTDITDCLKPKGEQSHDRIQKERDLQGIRKMHTELPFQ